MFSPLFLLAGFFMVVGMCVKCLCPIGSDIQSIGTLMFVASVAEYVYHECG